MRRLLYVPVLHGEADMGSAAAALTQSSVELSGEGRWLAHQEAVGRFWESLASFLRSFDPAHLKVYQDGLPADGEMGRHIVQEAANRGSQNYQLVLELLRGGAELRKTEDPALLLRERESALGIASQGERDRLLEERDRFIAGTIATTLKEGEIGVLFIGAYHRVVDYLPADIAVESLKELRKVRAYFEELFGGQDARRFQELAHYLASPVVVARDSC